MADNFFSSQSFIFYQPRQFSIRSLASGIRRKDARSPCFTEVFLGFHCVTWSSKLVALMVVLPR